MMRQFSFLTVIWILLTACTSTISPSKEISSETEVGCQPSKIQESQNGFLEIQGDMKSEGEMWALLFFETARANQEAKIVWRITGETDEFQAQAQSETGTVIQPIWVEYHGGSNWERPGQEWGTGFNFPTSGCWTITVLRGETTGEISLDVFAP
jgi:hypothetical protein